VAEAPPSEPTVADEGIQELELLDDEIVDITPEESAEEAAAELPPVAAGSGSMGIGLEFEAEEEQPPSSSRRPREPQTMDEALARATESVDIDVEHEVPLKTPPPESGPQAAMPLPPGLEEPLVPTEFDSGVHPAEQVKVDLSGAAPTNAQLGQTIELEEARGPALELDERAPSVAPPHRDELEVSLPPPKPSEAPALVPAAAAADLQPEPSAAAVGVQPELTERPAITADVSPAAFSRPAKPFTPTTFLELLDASLSLTAE
jgi:hypothetical protein